MLDNNICVAVQHIYFEFQFTRTREPIAQQVV